MIKKLVLQNIKRNGKLNCYYCSRDLSSDEYNIDHRNPLRKGGSIFKISNLVISCSRCNTRKHIKSAQGYLEIINSD